MPSPLTHALLLAAGLGTRLKPVTDLIPKALVDVEGMTLLERAIDHLKDNDIRQVIINVHHFPEQIIDFLRKNNNFGLNIAISDESGELLETGGGLKKAGWYFQNISDFIARNVDVVSDLDLQKVARIHEQSGNLATLVVRERETSRYLLFDEQDQLCGWMNLKTSEKIITRPRASVLKPLAFSGIQVLKRELLDLITETGKFSLTELYLRLSSDHKIGCYLDTESFWRDAGRII